METAMHNATFEAKRTPEGAIDIRHYAQRAHAERRHAKSQGMRKLGRGLKRAGLAITGLLAFWNIPPMGSDGSKEWPYR
jgi:hypothetical protein